MNIDWKLLCCRIWWFCPTGCRASSQRLACLNGQMFLQLVVENCIFSGNLTSTYRSRCYRTHGLGKGRMDVGYDHPVALFASIWITWINHPVWVQGEVTAEAELSHRRHRSTFHFYGRPTLSVQPSQHSQPASENKNSGAGRVPFSGITQFREGIGLLFFLILRNVSPP